MARPDKMMFDEVMDETLLYEQQMQRGICSDAACRWPIDGWCTGCRAKLCQDHLHEHKNLHARTVVHATLQQGEK